MQAVILGAHHGLVERGKVEAVYVINGALHGVGAISRSHVDRAAALSAREAAATRMEETGQAIDHEMLVGNGVAGALICLKAHLELGTLDVDAENVFPKLDVALVRLADCLKRLVRGEVHIDAAVFRAATLGNALCDSLRERNLVERRIVHAAEEVVAVLVADVLAAA